MEVSGEIRECWSVPEEQEEELTLQGQRDTILEAWVAMAASSSSVVEVRNARVSACSGGRQM